MRPLSETEMKTMFEKLANYTGASLNQLIAPTSEDGTEGERMVFRLQGSRVYYAPLALVNYATSIPRDQLLCIGTQIGKFSKTGRFFLNITSLSVIEKHARFKAWLKPNGVQPFLYGGSVVRAHIGRWSEDCPGSQGIVIYDMNDTPLGFGVTTRSTAEARKLEPTAMVIARQADCGEWLREEDTLFTT
ncbi:60S ribosome subunit biogenesis protein NIP7 [Penicillium chermesinum]|uniref:60S ribosome subunit biogenesis protein NIP7 n=1 Tax=Penicillium chermesinum TaxID=63820 RepID=A0A9W9P9R0_9EURO|nr:60S ribosome subunit biogenesis protein NIP7 [Penicillium chermesinum]KAJ5239203.1 60S ribosome subunit biogenesis protein NIP7 [Penicillium chermesinum]